jgi:hypothetical protein
MRCPRTESQRAEDGGEEASTSAADGTLLAGRVSCGPYPSCDGVGAARACRRDDPSNRASKLEARLGPRVRSDATRTLSGLGLTANVLPDAFGPRPEALRDDPGYVPRLKRLDRIRHVGMVLASDSTTGNQRHRSIRESWHGITLGKVLPLAHLCQQIPRLTRHRHEPRTLY